VERPFTQEDLEQIEAEMANIVTRKLAFQRVEMAREEAVRFFERQGEPYKVELLQELQAPTVSVYQQGDFVDMCRGPHLPHTGA